MDGKPYGRFNAVLRGDPTITWHINDEVLALQGHGEPVRQETVRLAAPLPANGPREHWMRARLGAEGVTAFADQDSSLVTVFAAADALLRRLPGAPAAATGESVDILRLDRA